MISLFLYKSRKILFIGGGIFISKVVFLLIPYLLDEFEYNAFNKIYYSAAIVVLLAKLGFEFAITRINLSHKKLFLAVFTNTIIALLGVYFFGNDNYNIVQYTVIFIYSFFYILANIFLIKNLFEGSYQKYFLYKLFYGFVLLFAIVLISKINQEIFIVFPIAGFIWFIFVYSFNWKNSQGNAGIIEFYKLGMSSFVINAAIGFAFISDKYIVNHFFNIDSANAYTFAWAITAPMLYIGNMIEHSIFASNNKNKKRTLLNSGFLLIVAVLLYLVSIYSFISLFPNLLPDLVDYTLFKNIIILLLIVYSVYTLIQFPLNGILFKYSNNNSQYRLAQIYPILLAVFVGALYILFSENNKDDYTLLISLNAAYLFILLGIKALVIRRNLIVAK